MLRNLLTTPSTLTVLTTAAMLAGVSHVGAAVVPTIDFDVTTDYDNNFREALNGGSIGWNAAEHVRYGALGDNSTSIIRYDTEPGTAAFDVADFLTETLQADATFSTISTNASAGFYTRIRTDNNLGVLALINAVNNTSAQVRLFYDASTVATTAGTTFFDATFNFSTGAVTYTKGSGATGSTNALTAGSPITLVLTQTDAADPVFNFTISDADGLIASTGNQVLSSGVSNSYDGPGAIGMRLNLPDAVINDVQQTILVDNFAAAGIPEPTSLTLAALAVAPLACRRRRAS